MFGGAWGVLERSVSPSVCLSVRLSVFLSVGLSVRLSVCLHVCLSCGLCVMGIAGGCYACVRILTSLRGS